MCIITFILCANCCQFEQRNKPNNCLTLNSSSLSNFLTVVASGIDSFPRWSFYYRWGLPPPLPTDLIHIDVMSVFECAVMMLDKWLEDAGECWNVLECAREDARIYREDAKDCWVSHQCFIVLSIYKRYIINNVIISGFVPSSLLFIQLL